MFKSYFGQIRANSYIETAPLGSIVVRTIEQLLRITVLAPVCTTMWFVIAGTAIFIAFLWFSRKKRESVLNVNQKYVMLTGCDTGLGRQTAVRLHEMGAFVLATFLTKEGEQSLKAVISDRLKTYQLDVTNSEQIREVFYEVKQVIGKSGKYVLSISFR